MKDRRATDSTLLIVAAILTAIGAVMVFSASSVTGYTRYHDPLHYLKRELVWVAFGGVALWFGATIDYCKLRKAAPWVLGLSLALLAIVLLPRFGTMEGGARRWFEFGFASFEPSELAKMALVIFLATLLAESPDGARSFKRIGFRALLAVGMSFALVVLEPDLGTAMLFAMTACVMLFVGGAPIVQLLFAGAVAVPTLMAFVYSSPYRHARFTAFLNPWKDPQGTGYHIIQSLYALGSGGIFGLGLGESRQKFGYLPEQFTDFIFAIIGEELGLIGAVAVVALFLVLAYRGIRIALKAEDRFGYYLAIGITAAIVLQALVNIGVVTSTWPVTGVPLPFVSYGGTSLVITLFGVGLLAGISRGRSRAAMAADSHTQDRNSARSSGRRRHGRSFVPRAVTSASALRRAR